MHEYLASFQNTTDLIDSVEEQLILDEADSPGFRDVIGKCTDWPTGSKFFSCTQHQNFDEELAFEVECFTGRLRRFENHRRLPYFLYIISFFARRQAEHSDDFSFRHDDPLDGIGAAC